MGRLVPRHEFEKNFRFNLLSNAKQKSHSSAMTPRLGSFTPVPLTG